MPVLKDKNYSGKGTEFSLDLLTFQKMKHILGYRNKWNLKHPVCLLIRLGFMLRFYL